jgi:hypothetical protein
VIARIVSCQGCGGGWILGFSGARLSADNAHGCGVGRPHLMAILTSLKRHSILRTEYASTLSNAMFRSRLDFTQSLLIPSRAQCIFNDREQSTSKIRYLNVSSLLGRIL